MQRHKWKAITRWCVACVGFGVFAVQGCSVDPDIQLRAALAAGSDLAIFLLQNVANSF